MCGIGGVHFRNAKYIKNKDMHKALEKFVDFMLVGLQQRGRDATGFVSVGFDGTATIDKKPKPAEDFIKVRSAIPQGVQTILLHTRLGTKGSEYEWQNNHPVISGDAFVTHNGVISNDDELFKSEKMERHAEVDSEVIAALIHKKGLVNAANIAEKLRGSFAFAAIQPVTYRGQVALVKGGTSPLVLQVTEDYVVWSSLSTVISEAWEKLQGARPDYKSYKFMEEGDILWLDNAALAFEKEAFKLPVPSWHGWGDWDTDDDYKPRTPRTTKWKAGEVPNSNKDKADHEVFISGLRAMGKGVAFVGHQGNMPEEVRTGWNGRWVRCNWCRDLAVSHHTRHSPVWNAICEDCYLVFTHGHPALTKKVWATEPPAVVKNIDVDELEKWVDIESDIHWDALLDVSAKFALSQNAVDYVLFRLGEDFLNASTQTKMKALYDELKEAYDESVNAQWLSMAAKEQKKQEALVAKLDEEFMEAAACDTGGSAYVACAAGTHRIDQPCEACGSVEKEKFKRSSAKSDTVFKCDFCKKKAKYYRATTARTFKWCSNHYSSCHTKKCDDTPVGWTPKGERKCHNHMRGVKGAYFEGDKKRYKVLSQLEAKLKVNA